MAKNQSNQSARLIFGVWIACAAGVILALFLFKPGTAPEPAIPPEPANEAIEPYDQVSKQVVPQEKLSKLVKRVDYALLQALLLTGYGPDSLVIKEIAAEEHLGEDFQLQIIELRLDGKPDRFLSEFTLALDHWVPEAEFAREGSAAWSITLLGRVTHQLLLDGTAAKKPVTAKGRLAVVIDDLGRSLTFARKLARLDIPLTFSIMPQAPHSRETAKIAAEANREVMLHQPMEPEGYPEVNPGPGALLTNMGADAIRTQLAENLAVVPMAKGVNNHTGSRYTQIESVLAPVMEELGSRGLFFLDSLTTPKSVAGVVAKRYGLAYYRRSIFLDNVRESDAILRQMKKAERLARLSGQAIAIGHPYPETLDALRLWLGQRSGDVQVVSLSELKPAHRQ